MTVADPAVFLLDVDNILLDINTLPEKTLLAEFARAGVDSAALADKLQREGIQSFAKPWNDLMARIASKSITQAHGKLQ